MQTARQVGGALGVAMLVAIVHGTPGASGALTQFRHAWWADTAMVAVAFTLAFLVRPGASAGARP